MIMKNVIDKDVNLFLPKKYNFLLLGGNFLLSKRLYEITKRIFDIKRIDYDFSGHEEYFSCIQNKGHDIYLEPARKIETIIDLYDSNVLILTSEILLYLSQTKFEEFLQVLQQVQKTNIKIIFLSIKNPLNICKDMSDNLVLTNMSSKTWYKDRCIQVSKLLNLTKDLIYNCSSYLTYVNSNIQTNIVELLKDKQEFVFCKEEIFHKFYLDISDNIINNLIQNLNNIGIIESDNSKLKLVNLNFVKDSLLNDSVFTYVNMQSLCSVNLVYRKKPNEIENNLSVANWRYNLGVSLGQNTPLNIQNDIDIIIPVPETGKYYAQGLSKYMGKTYVEAFYKKTEIGRSFDIANTEKRQNFLDSKLGLMGDLIAGKNIGIVDEAIFTGQTLSMVKALLNETKVNKIYFFIASPECIKKCAFNMMPERELLSNKMSQQDLKNYFNIDGIIFQKSEYFEDTALCSGFTCTECFK